jgi:hypothetical protein
MFADGSDPSKLPDGASKIWAETTATATSRSSPTCSRPTAGGASRRWARTSKRVGDHSELNGEKVLDPATKNDDPVAGHQPAGTGAVMKRAMITALLVFTGLVGARHA